MVYLQRFIDMYLFITEFSIKYPQVTAVVMMRGIIGKQVKACTVSPL